MPGLSWDKNIFIFQCLFVPEQRQHQRSRKTPLSQDIPEQNHYLLVKKVSKELFTFEILIFFFFFFFFHGFCPVTGSCPVPWQDFELVLLSLCPGTMKGILSLCPAGRTRKSCLVKTAILGPLGSKGEILEFQIIPLLRVVFYIFMGN